MEDSGSSDTYEKKATRSSSNQGLSSKLSRKYVCRDRGRKHKSEYRYRYPCQYIDESTNQEAPSLHAILESLVAASTFEPTNEDSAKGILDPASTLSSGYFSTTSQSSQPAPDTVDSCSQHDLYICQEGPSTFLRSVQSTVLEGQTIQRNAKQTWREPSSAFRRIHSSISPSCRALFAELPMISEGRNLVPQSVRFAKSPLPHSPAHKKPRFRSAPFDDPSFQDTDANLDDTMPIDSVSDEPAPAASSPIKLSKFNLDSDGNKSNSKESQSETLSISKHYFSRCASVPANITQDRLNASSDTFCSSRKANVLPVIERTGAGLNFISVDTVAHLINGRYANRAVNFFVVDCRFPYEYNAGHVRGAVNLYTLSDLVREVFHRIPAQSALENDSFVHLGDQLEQMLKKENSNVPLPVVNDCTRNDFSSNEDEDECEDSIIVDDPFNEEQKHSSGGIAVIDSPNSALCESSFSSIDIAREADPKPSHVIIFHCEFSSQRAPSMAKFLRKIDRTSNCNRYPFLFFPELYVMKGGYAEFFKRFSDLCEPSEYVKMFHRGYRSDLRYYRSLAKRVSISCDACFRNSSLLSFANLSGMENKENAAPRLRKVHTMYTRKCSSPLSPHTSQEKLALGDESPAAMELDDDQPSKCQLSDPETPGQSLDMLDDSSLRLAEAVVRVGEHVIAAFERGRRQSRRIDLSSILASRASGIMAASRQRPLLLTDSPPTPIRGLNARLQLHPMPLSFSSSDGSEPNSSEPSNNS